MANLTAEQIEIMRHALGLNYSPRQQRNYFCASLSDGETIPKLRHLCELGFMRAAGHINEERDQYFVVTEEGIEAVRHATPRPAKLTRSQRRYQLYLRVADIMSFREFLGVCDNIAGFVD